MPLVHNNWKKVGNKIHHSTFNKMIFLENSSITSANFNDAVKDCVDLSKKYQTTVLLVWNGKPVIIEPQDSKFIADLAAYYEFQRVNNDPNKFVQIFNILNSKPKLGE